MMKNKRLYVLLVFAALAFASPCQAQNGAINSTPQQALDKRQDAFQADEAKGVHASYQWELSGPNGGDWWLIVNNGTYKTGRGKIHNPNVTFAASDEDWVAMSNKTSYAKPSSLKLSRRRNYSNSTCTLPRILSLCRSSLVSAD
jgi:hypothetical protein